MIIFDCNGVLVDSEPIATAVIVEEFQRHGFQVTPEVLSRFFTGRRQADIFAAVELATGRKLPLDFPALVTQATLSRFRAELRPTPHVQQALTWLRGPKCVASSSNLDRVRVSLETTGLLRFFEPNLFSASTLKRGKPAPDLFLHAAAQTGIKPRDCIVVEDSPAGVAAAVGAGMTAIGFVGGSHSGRDLDMQLKAMGARAVIADMRALKGLIWDLRGW
ncbi:MAG: HAD family hydrolase [Pseudorhodoplanes sp.]